MNRWLGVSIALTVAALIGSLYVYYGMRETMPEQVPTHWGIKGEPDQWKPRDKMLPVLLLMPGAMALLVGLTVVLPKVSPKGFTVDRFSNTYYYLMAVVVALIGFMHFAITMSYLNSGIKTMQLMLAGMSLFFAAMGNVMGKVKRNFWMGVRTPWTLADERVWNQTHRLTGWLWVSFGLVSCIALILIPSSFFEVALFGWIGLLFAIVLIPVIYSLVLYKRLEKQGKLAGASSSPASGDLS
jgi:uncharacterized membrane protein